LKYLNILKREKMEKTIAEEIKTCKKREGRHVSQTSNRIGFSNKTCTLKNY